MKNAKFIKHLQVLEVKEGDIVIVNLNRKVTMEVAHQLRNYIKSALIDAGHDPGTPVMILEDGVEIGILRRPS